jgi:hypothetical protein
VVFTGEIAGYSDVHVDNKRGISDLLTHLINKHHYTKLAFIKGTKGHPDAEERFQVYLDFLEANHIPFDPELTYEGIFREESGAAAVAYFLQKKHKEIEAIIAANDAMAIGAIKALQNMNISVPTDIAVVGFDDVDEARAFSPPLTTVRQPFDEMCTRALEKLIKMSRGELNRESFSPPAEVIIRRSCGCFTTQVADCEVDENIRFFGKGLAPGKEIKSEVLYELMSGEIKKLAIKVTEAQFKELLGQFIADIKGQSKGKFLLALNEILATASLKYSDITVWQTMLSALRQNFVFMVKDDHLLFKMENLVHQARILVGEVTDYTQNYIRIMEEKQSVLLRDVNQSFLTAFDYKSLKEAALAQLPRLDIPSCFIFMQENLKTGMDKSKMICAYRNFGKEEIDVSHEEYKKHALPPAHLLPQDRRYTYAVHPLYTRNKRLGYILFELGPREGFIYDSLQLQISSSLMGSMLLEQREKTESIIMQRSNHIQQLIKPMLAAFSDVTKITNEKTELMNNLTRLTKQNSEKLSSTNLFIEQMGEKIYKMLDMINLIEEISVAVNTIAINASIQAARVGKYGSGFAIIASEIRKLADAIKGYTVQITGSLVSIRVNMDNSSQAGKESQAAFNRLEGDVQAVALDLQAIKAIMDDLSETSAEILATMQE